MSGEAGYYSPASPPAPQVLRISLIGSSSNVPSGHWGKWVVDVFNNPSPGLPGPLSRSRVATNDRQNYNNNNIYNTTGQKSNKILI